MATDRNLTRKLILSYVIALSLIALLAIGEYWLLIQVISRNESNAAVINRAGRQRMLLQRIALYAFERQDRIEPAHTELLRGIADFEKAHDWLTGIEESTASQILRSDAAKRIYFQAPEFLDQRCRIFIRHAKAVALSSDSGLRNEALQSVKIAAQYSLLPQLDKITALYEREATSHIQTLKRWQLLILISLIAGLLVEALFIFRPLVRKVHGSMDVLTQLACHDGLTQLANQRHFMEIAARELLLSHRSRQPIALLMIDIDHFKPINDTHGHAAGDAAIVLTAGIIKQAVRQTDIVGRIGGDEFAVLLSAADPQRVQIIAEKIRNAIAAARLRNCEMGWTVSIGATCWKYQDAEIEMLMKRADRALYLAKKSGRNCIIDDNACESGHPLDRDASV